MMEEQLNGKKGEQSLYFEVAPKVWGAKDVFVNFYLIENPDDNSWVLVDTGLKSSAAKIKRIAATLFGEDSIPSSIILTHGHFDHTGSLIRLADEWNVPVFCHYLEIPYLTGKSAYPPPDPSVGGGLMASMSWLYPKKPINIESHLNILPTDNSVPGLPGWEYFYTPGHAPGHISLFRRRDKVLIAGDAFVTTTQESVLSVVAQKKKISGPPKYFTYDWEAAHNSVRKLADLGPLVVATGHGRPMKGPDMQIALNNLAAHFDKLAVPKQGRYINDAALIDANGVKYIPPKEKKSKLIYVIIGASLIAATVTAILLKRDKE